MGDLKRLVWIFQPERLLFIINQGMSDRGQFKMKIPSFNLLGSQ
jgi:hypothetical protein